MGQFRGDRAGIACVKKKYSKHDIQLSLGNLEDHLSTCPTLISDVFDKYWSYEDVLPYDCGEMQVPLFHSEPDSKNLGLQFIYFYPVFGNGKNPIVMTQGGPGGSSIQLLLGSYKLWEKLIAKHGLIVFEYRGTDFSDPDMKCKFLLRDEDPIKANMQMAQCARYWKEKFDLSAINTTEVAHDLAFLTEKIGFEKIHYYGVSYGTLVGQYLARLHPKRIKSLILDGVAEYGKDWNSAEDIYKIALSNLEKNCMSDNFCRHVYGPLEGKLEDAVNTLNQNPIETYGYKINGNMLAEHLHSQLYSYANASSVYRLIAKWQNYELIEHSVGPHFSREINAVYWSVYCNERALSQQKNPSNTEIDEELNEVCSHWLPEGTKMSWMNLSEEAAEIPTLLLSGEYDPVTPGLYAEAVKKQFKNAKHHLIKGHGHGVFFESECVDDLVYKFLLSPSATSENTCGSTTDFLPEFVAADMNFVSLDPATIKIDNWEESEDQFLVKGDEKIRFVQHRFIGDPDEIFWLLRKEQGGYEHELARSSISIGQREWQIISSFQDEDKSLSLTMAFTACENSWFSIVHMGDSKPISSGSIKEIANGVEGKLSPCFINKVGESL